MAWMFGKTALWTLLTVSSAAFVFGAAQFEPEPGELIIGRSCTGCHDQRTIQTSAMTEEGWRSTVNMMVAFGAVVPAPEVPVLIEYLARHHGPVPEGPGREILLNICTMCHNLDRIRHHRVGAQEWEETLLHMLNEGAHVSDAQFPVILNYLVQNFPPEEE